MTRLPTSTVLLATLALTSASACATQQDPSAPVDQGAHDALRYHIEIDVDLAAGRVNGSVEYLFRADRALDQVVLDAQRGPEWSVTFLADDGSELESLWEGDRVRVELGATQPAGSEFALRAQIRGAPIDGFYFADNRYGERLAFTDHYSIRARGWLPCEDHPGDRAQFALMMSYPEDQLAVASGARPENGPAYDPKPGRLILHHETRSDIPPYMFALAVGPFATVEEAGDPRLEPHLVYRQDIEAARAALVHHAEWLRRMEEAFGPYPYAKYMVFQCPTRWGGFEAPGNVQISERLFESPRGVGTLAHELVHMWFGDGVGYAEWREVWLSEGFASYFGPWLWADTGGPTLRASLEGARARWRGAADGRTKTIRWDGFGHPDTALNTNTYQKGAWVLHMLRGELGDEAFFGALRTYYTTHAGSSVRTADFVASVEKATGRDLGWFFSQWLDRVGCPELRVELADGRVTIEQTQKEPPYRLRVPVAWRLASGATVKKTFEVADRRAEFEVANAVAGSLVLDPDVELLYRAAR